MTESSLEVVDVLEALESKLAYLPGGRDREGRPILIVNIPPSDTRDNLIINIKLEKLLQYLLGIFNDETKQNGICLIVDARKGCWRVARSYIRRSINVVGKCAGRTIVIRTDGFWEKRVDNCTKSWKDGEPIYVPIARLHFYVDSSQMTSDLSGTKYYEHSDWIQTRLRVEEYEKNAKDLIDKLTELEIKLSNFGQDHGRQEQEKMINFYWETGRELEDIARYIIHSGRILASVMSIETSQDFQDMIHRIHDLLDAIELKQTEVENGWSKMAASLDLARELSDLEGGVAKVTNWILGPADSMLNCHCHVGFDVASSENLRREHEELELECRETYGRYAKLLHRIDSIPDDCLTEDLKSQRDFMDFVCRSFATRLERRRNVLITSQRFFRLVSEYFDKTSEVFDNMILGNRSCSFSEAGEKLNNLEASKNTLDGLLTELIKEGEKLSDILSMPVKDALGRDVNVNYGEDISNIQDILDATNARKNIFNDSMELQKLTLKQIFLIHAYEKDAQQAVEWLSDLFGVFIENHVEIGCTATEIQSQKEELQSFQETAQGTFDYGCQLLNGARVLRISCRLTLDINTTVFAELRQAWRRLSSIGQEQLTRLRVCTVFHRNVDEHSSALNELIDTVQSTLLTPINSPIDESSDSSLSPKGECMSEVLKNREKLLVDVGRTVRLGRLLRTRLKEPLHIQLRMFKPEDDVTLMAQKNLTAIDAISERLAEVTRLAEKLDAKLYEAGARTRIPKEHETEKNSLHPESSNSSAISPASFSSPVTVTQLSIDKNAPTNDEKIIQASPEITEDIIEDINTEDYTTATECSVTPMPRSRSESFVTISECGDVMSDMCRFEADAASEEMQNIESSVSTNAPKRIHEPEIMNKTSISNLENMDINQNGIIDVNKTSGASIIETIEEKFGKVVKEVTEITTLRVSQDTKFGVASYEFTSNTLTENREEKKATGILDASCQYTNGCTNGYLDGTNKHCREEISISSVNAIPTTLENGYHSKQSTIVKDTAEYENHSILNMNEKAMPLQSRRNNDSGIEMTPRKNGNTDEDDDQDEVELLKKLKLVSCTPRVITESSMVVHELQ
ncbi:hypothetical protein PV327_003404 [Microctonus hyperodae]|uniref:SESTD1-like spectrin repeats region domain-containing protein n=1 Tax=Microctonus hyperodae TaxID=165561 RepID=A0AA39L157_MICHY|nr:hypothetical protein PV327_003404 [Microctonus hyperodae]